MYEHTTRLQLRDIVRNKIGETSAPFWPDLELNQSIEEALFTFGAISNFWREDIILHTEENKRIYDINKNVDVSAGEDFVIPSITVQKIVDWLNRDLIENLSDTNIESEFMSLSAWLTHIRDCITLFQLETGLILKRTQIPVLANNNIIELPDDLLHIKRVSFKYDIENLFNEQALDEATETEIAQFEPISESSEGFPAFYTNIIDKTKKIKLYPIPANVGTLDIIYVPSTINDITVETNIILPNNLVPYIKFGVEAILFSKDGILNDPIRAQYSQQRWQEGIFIARNYTSVIHAKANDRSIMLDSLNSLDNYFGLEKLRTPPAVLGFAGYNIFATDIVPSSEIAQLTLNIIANAKIPQADEDFILIDREYIDPLADYVVHLSMIKSGAAELAATDNLKNKFLQISMSHNNRLKLKGIDYLTLTKYTKQQEMEEPTVVKELNA